MLKMENNQFVRELVDTTDHREVEIYNMHQKFLTDCILLKPKEYPTPELFLEVINQEDAKRQQLLAEMWRFLVDAKSE